MCELICLVLNHAWMVLREGDTYLCMTGIHHPTDRACPYQPEDEELEIRECLSTAFCVVF